MQLKRISLSLLMMGVSAVASASGYHFGSQSVSAQGTAHANGAEAADASVLFYNPAGMSLLDGTNFSGGLTFVVPHSEFTNQGSTKVTGAATTGGNGDSFAPSLVAAPSFYFTHQLNSKMHVGLGIFVPYGAQLDYGHSWAGRYALESIKLETLNFNPSFSFKLDDRQSVGVGVSAQYMKAKLSKAVDVAGGFAILPGPTQAAIIAGLGAHAANLGSTTDGQASLDADGWGFGANVGYMFKLDDNTRFGLAYRSNIHHKLTGSATWDYSMVNADPVIVATIQGLAKQLGHVSSGGSVSVDTPESVSANAFHKLNDKVDLMADLTWTRHSRMKSIDIKFDQPGEGDLVIRQNWRDTYKLSLGMNYHYNDALTLRSGVAYDQSPVKDETLRHAALPDSDRYWLSVGANYKLNKASSLDFAYSYVMFKDAKMNYKDSCNPDATTCTGNGETTKGTYKTNLQFLGVQYNYRF
ncbi:OmpP1/FadL family transporter [Vogesella sp. LIG4]|uniref:OmpP1/FadL family transporter n=1 Tax=Vogesella sp. LIG4 TaxID=1192162 RepID=UPI00081F77CA|nr:OmpP1/FadL family transporter [Vogesella sp. LIG4]SCK27010.1 long-chain fatty acid transport protein [Vogesella sp. LIG4]